MSSSPSSVSPDEKARILRQAESYLGANIKLFSACADEQQTVDCSNVQQKFNLRKSKRATKVTTNDGGVCTSVMLKLLYKYHSNLEDNGLPTYSKLLTQLRNALKAKKYDQLPTLTSSRPVNMTDEFSIIPKNFNGSRKALIIGINYTGTSFEIPGCRNDAWNIMKFLKTVHGFQPEDFTILLDDGEHTNPTRENIVKALHRFAFSVKPGDAVFFYYAGHGRNKMDASGDEESGFDQAMLPVDFMESDDIVDDEIFRVLLVPLPKGSEMTAIVDCCHSGSIFDLPFEFVGDEASDGKEMDFRAVQFPHMNLVRNEKRRIADVKAVKPRASHIERVMIEPPKKKSGSRPPRNTSNLSSISEGSKNSRRSKNSRQQTDSTHSTTTSTTSPKPARKLRKPRKPRAKQSESMQVADTDAVKNENLQKVEENAEKTTNCMLGGCLLLLNPLHLFRVMKA